MIFDLQSFIDLLYYIIHELLSLIRNQRLRNIIFPNYIINKKLDGLNDDEILLDNRNKADTLRKDINNYYNSIIILINSVAIIALNIIIDREILLRLIVASFNKLLSAAKV